MTIETGDTVTWDFAGARPSTTSPTATTPSRRPDVLERARDSVRPAAAPTRGRSARPASTASSARRTPRMGGRSSSRARRSRRRRRRATADRRRRRPPRRRPRPRRRRPPPRRRDDHTVTPAPGPRRRQGHRGAAPRAREREGVAAARACASGSPSRRRCRSRCAQGRRRPSPRRVVQAPAGTRACVLRTTRAQARHLHGRAARRPTRWATRAPAATKTVKVK